MSKPLYDIYFTGQLIEGTDQKTAQQNLTRLFNTKPESVGKLFDGTPHALKRGIDKAGALKYKAVLHKAGMLVAFKTHKELSAPNSTSHSDPQKIPANTATLNKVAINSQPGLSLAPAGCDVLSENEKHVFEKRDIDTSEIKLVSAFAELQPAEKEDITPPDTSHISVANVGANILTTPTSPPTPLDLDLDAISIAPPGADLEQLPNSSPAVTPNISGISLAPTGSDLTPTKSNKKTSSAPNTDHLSISENY